VDPTQVPATVQAVLAARIDRLPPDEKRLLQSASVLRKDVPVGLLHAIADLSDDGLRQGLAHLQVAEFLYETHLFPKLEYTFKHALTLEVTYQSLLHERRRALHARVVDAIERLFPDRLIEQIGSSASAALSGTSMAAPHVAGAAALYLEANPSATPETVRQVLIENATRDQVVNPGPGSPNYLLYTGFVVGDPESSPDLWVFGAGSGRGSVVSAPEGINCAISAGVEYIIPAGRRSAAPSNPENALVASSRSHAVSTNGAVSAETPQVLSRLERASMITTGARKVVTLTPPPGGGRADP
jgi:subtilisin family serine protease